MLNREHVSANYIAPVVSTLLAGVVLLFLLPFLQSRFQASDKEVALTRYRGMQITTGIRDSINKNKEQDWFHVLNLKNVGSKDVNGLIAIVSDAGDGVVVDAGEPTVSRGSNPPKLSLFSRRLELRSDLLKRGESITFWVRSTSKARPSVRMANEGVELAYERDFFDGYITVWKAMFAIFVSSVFGVIVGGFVGRWVSKRVVRVRNA